MNAFFSQSLVKNYAHKLTACCSSKYEALDQAWQLLEKISGKTKLQLLLDGSLVLTDSQKKELDDMVRQRVELNKPLQYLLGSVLFVGLEIQVKAPILIPRPETEEWTLWLIKAVRDAGMSQKPLKILDLCTGTGCIALALAKALPQASVWGIDINPEAIVLAKENKRLLSLDNVEFMESDLYEALPANLHFDLIVSNPPYILEQEFKTLQPEVKNWEDQRALVIDDDQLLYKRIIEGAKSKTISQLESTSLVLPSLVLEVGSQVDRIEKMLSESGFQAVQVHQDMYDKPRWISARI